MSTNPNFRVFQRLAITKSPDYSLRFVVEDLIDSLTLSTQHFRCSQKIDTPQHNVN